MKRRSCVVNNGCTYRYGIRWSDLRDYFRPTFCNRNGTTFFYMQIARNINCTEKRASPSNAITCALFVDRYLRPRCLDAIRIENFATKNDDLSRNNADDSTMIAQKKKVMQSKPQTFLQNRVIFNFNHQWSIHLQR